MKISVWDGGLSDSYLKQVTQLGADCIDFGGGSAFPGVEEQGYPDLDELLKIKKRIRSWGLDINRVTLPNITEKFMQGQPDGEKELENTCHALRVFAEAGVPIARQRFWGDTFDYLMTRYSSVHRGGYTSRGESRAATENPPATPTMETLDEWWKRFTEVYGALVPIADECDINSPSIRQMCRTRTHPSAVSASTVSRIPSPAETLAISIVVALGRKPEGVRSYLMKSTTTDVKDVSSWFIYGTSRGSLATAGAFEEVLLDDGDMNAFKIVRELQKVGFDGCINADHIPKLEGNVGLAYSVGYIKALFAALAA